jgi:hypothetical protein
MKHKEIETYVRLKYFPAYATTGYLESLPSPVVKKLYDNVFKGVEAADVQPAASGVSIYALAILMSDPPWKVSIEEKLIKYLSEYEQRD